MGYNDNHRFYINHNLSPENSKLAYNCRLLKADKFITDSWFSNFTIKVKTLQNEVKTIAHEVDLVRIVPDFERFSFDKSVYITTDEEDIENVVNLNGEY